MANVKANVNAATMLALSKAVKDAAAKTARGALTPGEYTVDQVVHVKGTLTVGEDYLRAPTVAIPLLETMALLLHNSGFTREKSKAMLIAAMQGALTETGKGEGSILSAYTEVIKSAEADVKAVIGALPKATCAGPVTTKLDVEFVTENVSKTA